MGDEVVERDESSSILVNKARIWIEIETASETHKRNQAHRILCFLLLRSHWGEGEGQGDMARGRAEDGWGTEPETGKLGNVGKAWWLCGWSHVGRPNFKVGLTWVSFQTEGQFWDLGHLSSSVLLAQSRRPSGSKDCFVLIHYSLTAYLSPWCEDKLLRGQDSSQGKMLFVLDLLCLMLCQVPTINLLYQVSLGLC